MGSEQIGDHHEVFSDSLASLELDLSLMGSPVFREISVNKTFRHAVLQPYNLQPYNVTIFQQKDKKT